MAFAILEDENETIDLAIMPDLYSYLQSRGLLETMHGIHILGRKDQNRNSILVNRFDVLN